MHEVLMVGVMWPQMVMMMRATDSIPMNFGFTGKGNTAKPEGLAEIIKVGGGIH
jgi:urease alpha subunit